MKRRIEIVAASGLLLCTGAALAVTPSLVWLGDIPTGSVSSLALALSANGEVVGGRGSISAGVGSTPRAFRWTPGGGMVNLGVLTGQSNSVTLGMSADGTVLVGSSGNTGWRWTLDSGTMAICGELPGGQANCYARATNADGTIVVGNSGSTPAGPNTLEAFRWTEAEGAVGLGDFDGGLFSSTANGISADGSVIVGFGEKEDQFGNPYTEAFRWTEADGLVGLGDLPGAGLHSEALDVSADGTTVVGSSWSTVSEHYGEAFRWTESGGMQGLGFIGPDNGGDDESEARGVSGDGKIVVGVSTLPNSIEVAFIWTEADGMRSLRDVLIEHGVDLTHVTLRSADAISDDGTMIVGWGTGSPTGGSQAFLATIPPPPCPGDVNSDGETNVSDFNILAGNFGAGPGATAAQGDLTGDGFVNVSDFNILAGSFGCGS